MQTKLAAVNHHHINGHHLLISLYTWAKSHLTLGGYMFRTPKPCYTLRTAGALVVLVSFYSSADLNT